MWYLVLGSILLSFTANASVSVTAKIYDIDYGIGNQKSYLLLSSGHVAWLKKSSNKSRSQVFERAKRSQALMTFFLSDANEVLTSSVRPNQATQKNRKSLPMFSINDDLYMPTIVESPEVANTYFRESREVDRKSECFNRAHVWSHEWFKHHGLLSNKTWIFFTRRYIREFEYKWWFHVAPSLAVQDGGVIREKVMDKAFANRPQSIKEWTDMFMRDKSSCPRVQKFSDYANYPESESCFLMRSSMFFHQPFDLEILENAGFFKSNWVDQDLQQAYLETFNEEY